MFVAADFVLGIVCALLKDFETLCVGFAAPIGNRPPAAYLLSL